MTRQMWRLIVGAGCCLSLLSACAQGPGRLYQTDCRPSADKAALAIKDPPQSSAEEQEPKGPPRESPYHLIPPPPIVKNPIPMPQAPPPAALFPDTPANVGPPVQQLVAHHDVPPEEVSRLVSALNLFLKKRPREATAALKGYSPQTQDYLLRVLPTLATLEKTSIERLSPEEAAELQDQLENLVQTLRSRANLVIGEMCLCERIRGYGDYDPLPAGHAFQPTRQGRPGDLVQIYLELRNFATEPRDGYYQTCLDTTIELFQDHQGKPVSVWKRSLQDGRTPLRSLTPRHDCFNKYTFCVPNVGPGEYQLTIQIKDQTTAARARPPAHKTIRFVVAEPTP